MAYGQLSLSDQWKLIKPVWRICVAIFVVQLIGMVIGLFMKPIGFPFLDLWYGAAYATPVGLVFGLLWQAVTAPGSLSQNRGVIVFLTVLCVLLPLSGYLTRDIWLLPIAR